MKNDRSGDKKREKILTGDKKKIEKFKNSLWVKDDRKQTNHLYLNQILTIVR